MAIVWVDPKQWQAVRHVIDDDGIMILQPGLWENDDGPLDCWAISDVDGIFAYADTQQDTNKLYDHFSLRAVHETIEQHIARHA